MPFGHLPIVVIWDTTRASDLACRPCRVCEIPRRDTGELSIRKRMDLLDKIPTFGNPLMIFAAGDPLHRPDLFQLLRRSVELGLRTTIMASATPLAQAPPLRLRQPPTNSRAGLEYIRGTPEIRFTAIKISSNRRGISTSFESFEETAAGWTCDTGRCLAAGAADTEMDRVAAFVRTLDADNRVMKIESDRIVECIGPDLHAMALNYDVDDRRRGWDNVNVERLSRLPVYEVTPPDCRPRGFITDLRAGLDLPVVREAVA